jgi:hypothetical protein
MSSENLHEDGDTLPEEIIDKHRAITSLMRLQSTGARSRRWRGAHATPNSIRW